MRLRIGHADKAHCNDDAAAAEAAWVGLTTSSIGTPSGNCGIRGASSD
eukprot:CAMPEP_0198552326 /NCGR_PEP_ID=MMETSP1462-20131121/78390_1 /TAXON_ID=1333877 /ORGANISM="Brandtodinium nutriculum, Strain RCC3387" /LENGTH=47 /DNA_ID= /DNA_START= /DNA_END= /DNA_ORIENTATION=